MMVWKGSFCFLKQVWWRILTFNMQLARDSSPFWSTAVCAGKSSGITSGQTLLFTMQKLTKETAILRCIAAVFAKQVPHAPCRTQSRSNAQNEGSPSSHPNHYKNWTFTPLHPPCTEETQRLYQEEPKTSRCTTHWVRLNIFRIMLPISICCIYTGLLSFLQAVYKNRPCFGVAP